MNLRDMIDTLKKQPKKRLERLQWQQETLMSFAEEIEKSKMSSEAIHSVFNECMGHCVATLTTIILNLVDAKRMKPESLEEEFIDRMTEDFKRYLTLAFEKAREASTSTSKIKDILSQLKEHLV